MTLRQLIARLESENPATLCPRGFRNPHSYRGFCRELSFDPEPNVTVAEMLAAARSAIGETYQGWKGGDYTMALDTECHFSPKGDCDDLGDVPEAQLEAMLAAGVVPDHPVTLAVGTDPSRDAPEPENDDADLGDMEVVEQWIIRSHADGRGFRATRIRQLGDYRALSVRLDSPDLRFESDECFNEDFPRAVVGRLFELVDSLAVTAAKADFERAFDAAHPGKRAEIEAAKIYDGTEG